MKRLLFLLLCGWVIAAACLGCRPARPTPAPVAAADAAATAQAPPDSAVRQQRLTEAAKKPVQKSGILGLFSKKNPASSLETHIIAGARTGTRKCKGCTIVYGNATVAAKKAAIAAEGAVVAGKVKAPISTGSGDVVSQPKATQAAAAHGDGNTLGQTMPAPPPKRGFLAGLGAAVGAYVVPVIVVACIGAAVWFGWPVLLAWWRRRKQANS